ncbi:MAG: amidohydrolase family protein [Kiritimatiellia bacterium]|jgi:imidazolonepropionase-like amidohydrolase|nr:amidohydrolase family protein [Kiritimatiellia bacterium]
MKVYTNCTLFDGVNEETPGGMSVVVEGDRIREVTEGEVKLDGADVIDCGGRFLMPGLIDLHFHAYSASFNMRELDAMPKPLLVSYAVKHLEDSLQRGFTTVRDPGGGDVGLALAIERGLVAGPRFLYGGKALSQTGGHGDMRPGWEEEPCNCAYSGVICQVVDGVDEVRKVSRNELRKGAHHIKVFISGGVASPSDPVWMPQFTNDELRAAVEEAETRRKYVIAHCHTDEGAQRCVDVGIRSIDHASEVSDETARNIAAGGSYTVPTLAVVQEIMESGPEAGMPPESVAKIEGMLDQVYASIEACRRAGVKIGMGTDIFGTEYHDMQASEMRFRSEVDQPVDILRSATSVNAEIAQLDGETGRIEAGLSADLIVLENNPFNDLSVFERYREEVSLIVRSGDVIKNQLN